MTTEIETFGQNFGPNMAFQMVIFGYLGGKNVISWLLESCFTVVWEVLREFFGLNDYTFGCILNYKGWYINSKIMICPKLTLFESNRIIFG